MIRKGRSVFPDWVRRVSHKRNFASTGRGVGRAHNLEDLMRKTLAPLIALVAVSWLTVGCSSSGSGNNGTGGSGPYSRARRGTPGGWGPARRGGGGRRASQLTPPPTPAAGRRSS